MARHEAMKAHDEVGRRLEAAKAGDPRYQPRDGRWFAWRPVWGWDYEAREHRFLWGEWVTWFRPLDLFYEYFTVRGSLRDPNSELAKWKIKSDELFAALKAKDVPDVAAE
jgi:hypothetical protein